MIASSPHGKIPISSDWNVNRGRPTIQVTLFLFRIAQAARHVRPRLAGRLMSVVASGIYRGFALAIVSVDIPTRTKIGSQLSIHHGFGLVLHADSIVGNHVVLRQGVTLGATKSGAPTLGDAVEVGASALILGGITVGASAVIGGGAVVVKSVRRGATVVGNPAREI